MNRNSFNNNSSKQFPTPPPPPPPHYQKSAIVINSKKWNSITNHLLRGKEEKLAAETNNKYKEYSRQQSNAMTKSWENSIEQIREKKIAERAELENQKLQEGENSFKKLKENDEKIRMERIAAAAENIKKLKSGPQSLERAYQLSDVLRYRQIQCDTQAEMVKREKNQHLLDGRQAIAQAEQECQEYKQTLLQKKQQVLQYKKDLRAQIDDMNARKKEMEQYNLQEENKQRERADEELKRRLYQEKLILQSKKDIQRRNALEAMKMAEERRIRIKMINEMENKVSSVFAGEENNIPGIRKDLNNLAVGNKEKLRSMIMEKVFTDCTNKSISETKSHVQAVKEYDDKFQKQEQINRDLAREAKKAKIREHFDELARIQRIKENEKIEQQKEITNRLKNNDVNFQYDRERRQCEYKRVTDHRQDILRQIKANQLNKNSNKTTVEAEYLEKVNQEDDTNFFEFARELTEEARLKKRPILPLVRAVETYKKENRLNPQSEYLPHLQTNINIGLKSPTQKTASSTYKSHGIIIKYDPTELKKIRSMVPPSKRHNDVNGFIKNILPVCN